ncbi:MAG TPA: hypothetical protein PKA69_14780, partial [Lacibacter sp.]|nr:hypothetical protein [Lacibacter sp.]
AVILPKAARQATAHRLFSQRTRRIRPHSLIQSFSPSILAFPQRARRSGGCDVFFIRAYMAFVSHKVAKKTTARSAFS